MNISTKTLVLCLCIAIGTTLSVFLIAENRTKKVLTEEIKKGLKERASNVLVSIDRFIYERQHDIKDAAELPGIGLCRGVIDTSGCQQLIEELQNSHQVYETFSYFDTNRVRLADSKRKALFEQHEYRTYWKDMLEKGATFDISISESLQRPVMHFGKSVQDENGNIQGYIVARVSIEYLYEVFEEAANHSTENHVSIDLINKEGLILFSNDTSKKILVDTHHVTNSKQFLSMKESLMLEDEETLTYLMQEKGYYDYKGNEWLVVFSVDKEKLYASMGELHNQLLILFTIIVFIIAGITYFFAKHITKPLKRLTHVINEYRSGDESKRAEVISKTDESGALAISFNEMADEINRRIGQQKETNKLLKFKVEEITNHRDLITDQNRLIRSSIRYAKNIQKSILPGNALLATESYELTVFYRPLDVVGGDFYFIESIKNEDNTLSYYIAVIDCTGHGVPGAFMTIIAQNLLSNAIAKYKNCAVGEILTHLNVEVKNFLKQDSDESLVNDGFDIALVRYTPEEKLLEYAGAYRPLIYFDENRELKTIKGDRVSIGGSSLTEAPTIYSSHEIKVNAGDEFFMFTDGITDQFDSENKRKYSTKRLKRVLAEIVDENTNEKVFTCKKDLLAWKGNNDQTDDMLFAALKIKEGVTSKEVVSSNMVNNLHSV